MLPRTTPRRSRQNHEQERQFSSPIGSRVNLVEFQDGEAIEVSGAWLERMSSHGHAEGTVE
jgi:hypothetical protein